MRPLSDKAMPVLGENIRAARLGFAWSERFEVWLRVSDDLDRACWRFDVCMPGQLPKRPDKRWPTYRAWWDDPGLVLAVVGDVAARDDEGRVIGCSLFIADDGSVLTP